jgi:hypothetical protein
MWRPTTVIEDYFSLCEAESHYSADFDINDYESTDIEIVLETLFDDQRLHLTEKTLRPIAMGQPFMLAGTSGSLQYLQNYGFKTFADCWDESYDMMTDSLDRMNKIVDIMKNITCMTTAHREKILEKAKSIAEYNKKHFFSKEFQDQITKELHNNLATALTKLESTNTAQGWIEQNKKLFRNSKLESAFYTPGNLKKEWMDQIDSIANQYYIRSLKHNT